MKIKTAARWVVRLVFLAAAIAAIGGFFGDARAASMLPAFSPLTALAGLVAGRAWLRALPTVAAPTVLLALAVWKGRLFCRWACPLGTLYALPSAVSRKKILLRRPINGYLFWLILAMAAAGAPLLLFLDPLSAFNRLNPMASNRLMWLMLAPSAVAALFFLLCFIQPMIWCAFVCPLGYLFDLMHRFRLRHPMKTDQTRRQALLALVLGLPLGLAARAFGVKRSVQRLPVLPPGAGAQEHFSATCTRCYACVRECAARGTGVLTVKPPVDRGFSQLFQPELDTSVNYCSEHCNACSEVCPTGALKYLTPTEKHSRQIGVAKIDKTLCLAWQYRESCMVCDEYCPYGAIDSDESETGLLRPVVNTDVCRGCGSCEYACPAYEKAIVVHGLPEQKTAITVRPSPLTGTVGDHPIARCSRAGRIQSTNRPLRRVLADVGCAQNPREPASACNAGNGQNRLSHRKSFKCSSAL